MTQPELNRDQIARTFHLLSGYNGMVRWAAIRGKELQGGWTDSPTELIQFAEAYSGWNFYVQLNPSNKKHGNRCTAAEVAAWEWFPIDLDPAEGADVSLHELEDAATRVKFAVRSYLGKDYEPVVVYSGRGMQLWYHVAVTPLAEEDGTERTYGIRGVELWHEEPIVEFGRITLRDAIVSAQRYWLSQLATRVNNPRIVVDPSVSDLPRLMRCPGTINQKTQNLAYIRSGLDDVQFRMGAHLLRYTPNERMYSSAPTDEDYRAPAGTPWQAVVSRISPTPANFLTFGATEPGRHRACSGAARALAEVGLSELEVLRGITHGGVRSRPELLDPEYLERTARDAIVRAGRISLDSTSGGVV